MGTDPEDFYDNPQLYDLEYDSMVEDLLYYSGLARDVPRLLELGCGTGRLTLPMARTGAEIVAVDRAQPMLHRLHQRLERSPSLRVTLRRADMRQLDLGERFPLVVLGFNAVHHMQSAEELHGLLARVAAHLAPGGRFALDMIVPNPRFWERDANGIYEMRRYRDPDGGWMKTWENGWYDPITQVNHVRYHYRRSGGRYQVVEIPMRMYYPQEFLGLVRLAGWTVDRCYGNFDQGKLLAESGKMVLQLLPPGD